MVSKNDFNKICRICGSPNGACLNLFCEAGKGYLFKVQKLFNVNISEEDGLPKSICHICIAYVSDFDTFRKQFGTVQTKLKLLSNNLQQETSTNVSTTTHISSSRNIEFKYQNIQGEKISSFQINHEIQKTDESNQSCDSNTLEGNKIKTDTDLKEWSVHVVKGTTTTNKLHICKKCGAVLISESAIQAHECGTLAKLPQQREYDTLKRKRVIFDEEDD